MGNIAIMLPIAIWKVDKIVKIWKICKYSRYTFLRQFV